MQRPLLVLCIPIIVHTLQAQQWEVFDMNTAGFPSVTVQCLAQDGQGRIWAGTDWGLCVQNGDDWDVLQVGNSGLPSNMILSLHVDAQDRVWVGTVDAGMAMFDGSDWAVWNMQNSPLPDDQVNAIAVDQQDRVWVATPNGLALKDGNDWVFYNDTPESHNGYQFFGKHMRDVSVGPDGTVAVTTLNGGFACFNEQEFICYTSNEHGFPDNSGYAVVFDQQGDRWLGTPAAGVVHHAGPILGGLWFMYSTQTSPIPENTIRAMAVDATGRKIIGTELSGLALLDAQGGWSTVHMGNSGLPDDNVRALLVDGEGILWVGMQNGGLARYAYATGIADVDTGSMAITIWPNPTADRVLTELPQGFGTGHWYLHDASGRLLLSGAIANGDPLRLDMQEQVAGTYVLRIEGGGRSLFARFVKQ